MKFLLTRTSVWGGSISSLGVDTEKYKITEESYDNIDRRRFKSPEEYSARLNKDWFKEGTNHKIVPSGIERTFKDSEKGVFIEITSLEELVSFNEEYGDIIISGHYKNYKIKKIEIYDGYRE